MSGETPKVELTLEQECDAIEALFRRGEKRSAADAFTTLARLLKQLSTEVEEVLDVHQERLEALEGPKPPTHQPSAKFIHDFLHRELRVILYPNIEKALGDCAQALLDNFDVRYKPGRTYPVEKVEQE